MYIFYYIYIMCLGDRHTNTSTMTCLFAPLFSPSPSSFPSPFSSLSFFPSPSLFSLFSSFFFLLLLFFFLFFLFFSFFASLLHRKTDRMAGDMVQSVEFKKPDISCGHLAAYTDCCGSDLVHPGHLFVNNDTGTSMIE